jgi:hypothetical protein
MEIPTPSSAPSDSPSFSWDGFQEFMGKIQAEFNLIGQMSREESLDSRMDIARELLKKQIAPQPFYNLWFLVHRVYACLGHAWTDDGFAPSAAPLTRDVLILAASSSGHECILNGGFHQFFFNHTGVFAPEMAEWLQRIGCPCYAALLKETMTLFGTEYPRSQEKRQAILGEAGAPGYDWLDDKFRELENSGEIGIFETKAEHWLREHLGVADLQTPPPVNLQYSCDS